MSDKVIIRLAGEMVGLAAVVVAVLLASLFGLIPDRWFWIDFFAFLLAGGIILALAGLLIPRYLAWLNRPQLEVSLSEGTCLSRYLDGRIKGTVSLTIRNLGPRPVRDFAWHLFLPQQLNVEVTEVAGYGEKKNIGSRKIGQFTYVHGQVGDEAILPGVSFEMPVRIRCDTADSRPEWILRWAMNTETGPLPPAFGQHRKIDAAAVADGLELFVPVNTSLDGGSG